MAKMAMRRMTSSRPAMSSCASTSIRRRRSSSGTTRPLQTMIASATESTITIAVAADSPPMKAKW